MLVDSLQSVAFLLKTVERPRNASEEEWLSRGQRSSRRAALRYRLTGLGSQSEKRPYPVLYHRCNVNTPLRRRPRVRRNADVRYRLGSTRPLPRQNRVIRTCLIIPTASDFIPVVAESLPSRRHVDAHESSILPDVSVALRTCPYPLP